MRSGQLGAASPSGDLAICVCDDSGKVLFVASRLVVVQAKMAPALRR